MTHQFWSNPPWASGNANYQMSLNPISNSQWCKRYATPQEQAAKRELISRHKGGVLNCTADSAAAQQLLVDALRAKHQLADIVDLSLRDPSALKLAACALTVPEDLCLLQRDSAANKKSYRLVAACVCAPSYWHLPDKVGLSLHEIHDTVPGLNDALGDRMAEFFVKLPLGRVFERRNWLIHSSNSRFQPRPETREVLTSAKQGQSLIVRSETQSLRRLNEDVIVFTIGVDCYPLADIESYPPAAVALKQALLSKTTQEREAASQVTYERAVIAFIDEVSNSPIER